MREHVNPGEKLTEEEGQQQSQQHRVEVGRRQAQITFEDASPEPPTSRPVRLPDFTATCTPNSTEAVSGLMVSMLPSPSGATGLKRLVWSGSS